MPVREQQQQERDGQHDDRDPARLIERDEHEPRVLTAGMDQVTAELTETAVTPKKTPMRSISHPIEFSGRRDAST